MRIKVTIEYDVKPVDYPSPHDTTSILAEEEKAFRKMLPKGKWQIAAASIRRPTR